ncbi:MAG: MBL fold metallo-hydrolase [Desulfobacterales bacterium]|uniref:MBL fold metallo-hydrolase n=1 Tax=Candidatus Desulfatibia profunda TaxID=2841695 RepID=A0A8J6NRP0_9BACT|nr:MBL fold metallo-hydrolase [Candidatus Desulfatibia profunda]MBL7180588.1 MBL fold metallo-hydrolase [Desulfobacterales bacterium]
MTSAKPVEISVTILGSGTCVPSLRRSSCSVFVKIKNSLLLFDSGPGTMRRLLEAGTTIFDISHLFYSHLHPDHAGEMVPFLFANKYGDGFRRKIPLTIVAAQGFSTFYNRLKSVYGSWIELAPGFFNIIELAADADDVCGFDNFKIRSSPVEHIAGSIAYRVTSSGGRSVVYSGDTDFCESLISLAKDADLLICESAHPDDLKVKGHLTPSLAGEIARRANVRKLVLTHFYPECDHADIEKECRKTYAGPLMLAEDLMNIGL